jgi:hypothetical protein
MTQATLAPGELARRWLLAEAGEREPSALAAAFDRLYGRMHRHLSPLVGRMGVAALLTRALRLAQAEFPMLLAVGFDAGAVPALRGVTDFAAIHPPTEVEAALSGILAHFIGLLFTFIGEDLTMRLLGEIWTEPERGVRDDTGTEGGR